MLSKPGLMSPTARRALWPAGETPSLPSRLAMIDWRRMLECGAVDTVAEIAAKEKINSSYVSRVLRLTLLAPAIVEAILDGRQAAEVTLPALMAAFPVEWGAQRHNLELDQRS